MYGHVIGTKSSVDHPVILRWVDEGPLCHHYGPGMVTEGQVMGCCEDSMSFYGTDGSLDLLWSRDGPTWVLPRGYCVILLTQDGSPADQ
jgi:hypothetical protein